MRAVFSMKDIETLLSAEAQRRCGAEDVDGCSFKTEVAVVTTSTDFIEGGSDEISYAVVINVALPTDVADEVVSEPTAKQKVETRARSGKGSTKRKK